MKNIMNYKPLVGIVILNWNGWQDTLECLKSLKDLNYCNYRIYVVDNASTDDSIFHIEQNFPNVRIICSSENGGFAKGNNVGIKEALRDEVQFVWLLNNDTTVSVFALDGLINESASSDAVGVVGSVIFEYYQPWKVQAWGGGRFNRFLATASLSTSIDDKIEHINGASMFIRADALKDAGYLEEKFFFFMEDTELSLRIRRHGWEIAVANDSYVFHKGGASFKGEGKRNIKSDAYFVSAVGKFMGIVGMPYYLACLRFFIIILRRLLRKQFSRIPIITRLFWENYKQGKYASPVR